MKNLDRDKHSSLFCHTINLKEISFIGLTDTCSQWFKTFSSPSLVERTNKLGRLSFPSFIQACLLDYIAMRLCHPPDGSTSHEYKLLCFITTKFF
jgi:hypothetical protein